MNKPNSWLEGLKFGDSFTATVVKSEELNHSSKSIFGIEGRGKVLGPFNIDHWPRNRTHPIKEQSIEALVDGQERVFFCQYFDIRKVVKT